MNQTFEMLVCIITMLVLVNLYQLHIVHNAHTVLDVFMVVFISINFKLHIFCDGYVISVRY